MKHSMLSLSMLLLCGCASAPVKEPSGNVRASCPDPDLVQSSIESWYRLCRAAALVERSDETILGAEFLNLLLELGHGWPRWSGKCRDFKGAGAGPPAREARKLR